MNLPIPEQIARKIAERLETITAGNGYAVTAEVHRPRRQSDAPRHNGATHLMLVDVEEGLPETSISGVMHNRVAVFAIEHFVEPSDHDDRPLDTLQTTAISEIERALAKDFYHDTQGAFAGGGAYAALGHSTELRKPDLIFNDDGSSAGVRITIAVGYRHTDLDPYTAL